MCASSTPPNRKWARKPFVDSSANIAAKRLPLEWTEKDGKPTERYPQMQSARGFANKIWNAARFVLSSQTERIEAPVATDLASRWIESRLNATIAEVSRALESYEFEAATSAIYNFIWGDFCDWFLETSKPKLRAGDANHAAFMAQILETSMRLLHPFMPFVSRKSGRNCRTKAKLWRWRVGPLRASSTNKSKPISL
jgi:valyl-tRNA synthetase